MVRHHLLPALVMRLRSHQFGVVIIKLKTTVLVGVYAVAHMVGRIIQPGRSHGCYPVRTTGWVEPASSIGLTTSRIKLVNSTNGDSRVGMPGLGSRLSLSKHMLYFVNMLRNFQRRKCCKEITENSQDIVRPRREV